MKLSKLNLSNVVAVGHSDGYLQLLLDLGNELEFVEIPAPIEAFEGLQHLNDIVAEQIQIEEHSDSIAMLPVDSSMANTVGYDEDNQILQVEFHNGTIYQYSGVDEDTWEDFCQAESVGRFYNEEIKGKYDSQRF
jgi:KTSC domain